MKILVSALICSCLFLSSAAQVSRYCDTYQMNKLAEERDPSVIQNRDSLNLFIQNYISNAPKAETVYIIPVVFHVVHNYGDENISREQILDAIRILNDDYRKRNPDTSYVESIFLPIVADCKIEFRLAKKDPWGNCTDGITRTASPLTNGADDNVKEIAPSWDRTKYLNVWVVHQLSGGAAGYSYYPSSVNNSWGAAVDGVILLESYVGSIGTSMWSHARVLTHEIGHYLNLMHPWGNSNDPGLPENCDNSDYVDDTPPTIGHTSCDLGTHTCGEHDNVQNYMEYSYCTRMYTNGQKDRMRATLNSNVSGRNNLWSPANLISTGTNDGYVASVCIPVADFGVDQFLGCQGMTVQYFDMSYNTDTISSRSWIFPGGTPAVSSDVNPVIYYPDGGNFLASLTVINPSGSDQVVKNEIIQLIDTLHGFMIPFSEGFELASFPVCLADTNKNWTIVNDGTEFWHRSTLASVSGISSVEISNGYNIEGSVNSLISPNIVLSGSDSSLFLTFKWAYSQTSSSSNDRLSVYFSFDCGENWYLRWSRYGYSLSTSFGSMIPDYIPASGEWKTASLNLGTNFGNRNFLRIRFVSETGAEGNNLYLDNINIADTTGSSVIYENASENNFRIFPNPFENYFLIEMEASLEKETCRAEIFDLPGKFIRSYAIKENPSVISCEDLPAGFYIIRFYKNDVLSGTQNLIAR